MPTITRSKFPAALDRKARVWFDVDFKEWDSNIPYLFQEVNSDGAFEEFVSSSSLGLLQSKGEEEGYREDSMAQGHLQQIRADSYALGVRISIEMIQDGTASKILRKLIRELARSARITKEYLAFDVINNGFNPSVSSTNDNVGADGLELFSTVHRHPGIGGTWANELLTSADLSEASLRQALLDIRKWKDDRNKPIAVLPQMLVIPPELEHEADILVNSPLRSGTANNDINTIRSQSRLPKGILSSVFIDDPDSWYIKTDCPDSLIYLNRFEEELQIDSDFDTYAGKHKLFTRFKFYWASPRGIFGSPGL